MLEELKSFTNPAAKLSRMVKRGECFPIVKGLYETGRSVSAYLLAGSIYGPSYISFEYVLAYYGIIQEAVYVVTCATFEKKKYETTFGTFTYRDIPAEAFPLGLRLVQEGKYFYRIAEREKALCDKLYTLPPVKNTRELELLLQDGLRIETEELQKMDKEKIWILSGRYHSTNIKKLSILLRRIQK